MASTQIFIFNFNKGSLYLVLYIYISYIQFMNSFFGLYYDSKDNYIEKYVFFNYLYHPKNF